MRLHSQRYQEALKYSYAYSKRYYMEAETSSIWAQSNTVHMADFNGGEVQQCVNQNGEQKTHVVNCKLILQVMFTKEILLINF